MRTLASRCAVPPCPALRRFAPLLLALVRSASPRAPGPRGPPGPPRSRFYLARLVRLTRLGQLVHPARPDHPHRGKLRSCHGLENEIGFRHPDKCCSRWLESNIRPN